MTAKEQLKGSVRFDGTEYIPVSEKIAGKSRKVMMLAAIFKDSAGHEVGLSHRELDEWIDRGVKPVRLKIDIPRDALAKGRDELAAMENAFYLPEHAHSDVTH